MEKRINKSHAEMEEALKEAAIKGAQFTHTIDNARKKAVDYLVDIRAEIASGNSSREELVQLAQALESVSKLTKHLEGMLHNMDVYNY